MSNSKTQEERLDYLVEEFKADSDEYKDLQTSKSVEEKRRILRSLMNIRMPKEISSEILKVQDEYLSERAVEKGIVNESVGHPGDQGWSIYMAGGYHKTFGGCHSKCS